MAEPPTYFEDAGFPETEFGCALCHREVPSTAFCWGCGCYVCDECDLHMTEHDVCRS